MNRHLGYHQIGVDGRRTRPTIVARPDFNPEELCLELKNAMKGIGTDEKAIIRVLSSCDSYQRVQLKNTYKSCFGKNLIDEFKSELSGDFEKLVLYLMDEWQMVFAKALYDAMKGAGTKESVVIECLCTLNAEEINEVKAAYKHLMELKGESPNRTLEKDIIGDLSGHFEKVIVALLQAEREPINLEDAEAFFKGEKTLWDIVDHDKASQDCAALYDAGAGKLGTDEGEFIRIIVNRNKFQLAAADQLYRQDHQKSILQAIGSETSGDFGRALKLVLKSQIDSVNTSVDLLKEAMDGLGTNDKKLMRIIVSRSEIDLEDIKDEFEKREGKTLIERVKGETSGDYRRLLVALLGESC